MSKARLFRPPGIERARSGDDAAFAELTEPYRRELHLHCYRMLGSFDDAGQPALAVYAREDINCLWRASELLVITMRGEQVAGLQIRVAYLTQLRLAERSARDVTSQ